MTGPFAAHPKNVCVLVQLITGLSQLTHQLKLAWLKEVEYGFQIDLEKPNMAPNI